MFGPLFTVLPGVVAFNYFNGSLDKSDNAYPALVTSVLPEWAFGLFGAVIFGAILSSFVGSLNNDYNNTRFLNLFLEKINQINILLEWDTTVVIGVIVVALAPVISLFPSGLYAVVQQFNGVYSMPMLALILVAFFSKRTSKLGAKVTLFTHIILYAIINFVFTEINYLYTFSVLFFVD